MKAKLKTLILVSSLFMILAASTLSAHVYATMCFREDFATSAEYTKCLKDEADKREVVIPEPSANADKGVSTGSKTIDRLVQSTVDLLSAITGIIIVLSIIIGGIQYMTARDNSSQVAAAKNRILMSVLSLILFIFAYTILQWLVPGGIF
jgi:hypothetical protein